MELAGFLLLSRDLSAHSCSPLPHEESRSHSGSQPRAFCPRQRHLGSTPETLAMRVPGGLDPILFYIFICMPGCWETTELARSRGDGKGSSVGEVSLGTLFEDKT